jgi:hypothetical protein
MSESSKPVQLNIVHLLLNDPMCANITNFECKNKLEKRALQLLLKYRDAMRKGESITVVVPVSARSLMGCVASRLRMDGAFQVRVRKRGVKVTPFELQIRIQIINNPRLSPPFQLYLVNLLHLLRIS